MSNLNRQTVKPFFTFNTVTVRDLKRNNDLKIFPNPVNNKLYLEKKEEELYQAIKFVKE